MLEVVIPLNIKAIHIPYLLNVAFSTISQKRDY